VKTTSAITAPFDKQDLLFSAPTAKPKDILKKPAEEEKTPTPQLEGVSGNNQNNNSQLL